MKFDKSQLDAIQKRMRQVSDEKMQEVERLLEDCTNEAANDAKELAPVNVGNLRQGIRHRVDRIGKKAVVFGTVLSNAEYSQAIEFGRGPGGRPPVGDGTEKGGGLWYWVIRKKIASKKDAQRVAFAIAKKIEQFGTKPQPFMRPSFEKWNKVFITKATKVLK